MSERAAGDVGEDLLDDRVVTVLALSLDALEGGVGEDGVVAPDREQLALPVRGFPVQVADPADEQACGDRLALLRRERRVLGLGDLGAGDPGCSWSSQIARGYLMVVQASSGMAAIAARILAFIGMVTEKNAMGGRLRAGEDC